MGLCGLLRASDGCCGLWELAETEEMSIGMLAVAAAEAGAQSGLAEALGAAERGLWGNTKGSGGLLASEAFQTGKMARWPEWLWWPGWSGCPGEGGDATRGLTEQARDRLNVGTRVNADAGLWSALQFPILQN